MVEEPAAFLAKKDRVDRLPLSLLLFSDTSNAALSSASIDLTEGPSVS